MSPLIGVTTEFAEPDPVFGLAGHVVERHLCEAIELAGGIPVALPSRGEDLPAYFDQLSGLVLSGGGYASPTQWYVEPDSALPYPSSPRLDYTLRAFEAALAAQLPVLGICAGMQLIAGYHGAKLSPRVYPPAGDPDAHWCPESLLEGAHTIHPLSGSLLEKLVGPGALAVNSLHREVVAEGAPGIVLSALSQDGVVEACEVPHHNYCVGVQWHPEQMLGHCSRQHGLFAGLVESARRHS